MTELRISTSKGEFVANPAKEGVVLTRPDGKTATISDEAFKKFLIENVAKVDKTPEKDTVEKSADKAEKKEAVAPPKISFFRALFSSLSDEQIDTINENRRLPENAKFVRTSAGYAISNNIMGLRVGTRTLPDDFELSKTLLGFTAVVPKDSEGLLLRNDD